MFDMATWQGDWQGLTPLSLLRAAWCVRVSACGVWVPALRRKGDFIEFDSMQSAPARAICAFAVCLIPQRSMRQRDGGVQTPQALNRILVEKREVDWSAARVTLPPADTRASHVREILQKGEEGDTLKAGVADEFLVDGAPVSVLPDLSVVIDLPEELRVPPPSRPQVTLMLALPRPKVLQRLLPHIAAIGVKQIVLVNAFKVERMYFDSDIVKTPAVAREALLEGIMQSGIDVNIPIVTSEKRLKPFLEDTLPSLCPSDETIRIIAEPDAEGTRIADVVERVTAAASSPDKRVKDVLLAVGPEGGWMPREISMMCDGHSFHQISMGPRVLKTDAAVIILLGLVHDALDRMQKILDSDGGPSAESADGPPSCQVHLSDTPH